MKKLTPDELRERDVEYIVPDGTRLPDEVRKTLRLYNGTRVQNPLGIQGTRYTIPAYLAREWIRRFHVEHIYGGDDG